MGKDFRVTGVRRLAAKHAGTEAAATQNLVHQAKLYLAVALAAELRAEMTRPEVLSLDDLFERRHRLGRGGTGVPWIAGPAKNQIEGLDLLARKRFYPVQLALKIAVCLKAPAHATSRALPDIRWPKAKPLTLLPPSINLLVANKQLSYPDTTGAGCHAGGPARRA